MHRRDDAIAELTEAIVALRRRARAASTRRRSTGRAPPAELRAAAGPTITPDGIGGLEALRVFADVLAPACISVDHPRFLSFVPAAPTEASILFDLVVGASSIYGGSWLEGGGAVFAENEALRWIADLAGLPAGGRRRVRQRRHGRQPQRAASPPAGTGATAPAAPTTAPAGLLLASGGAHSSVAQAARAMDADVVVVPADDGGPADRRRRCAATVDGLDAADRERLFAVVATRRHDERRRRSTTSPPPPTLPPSSARGCTSTAPTAAPRSPRRASATASPASRPADSFIVDPHKWLFAPFDSCALLYRDPEIGRRAHTQHAEYLDVLHADHGDADGREWNASDYAHHLSRRARGLPLWFSLATHGTDAYTDADRDDAARRPRGRRPRARRAAPRAAHGAGAVGRAVPAPRLGRRRLPGVERRPAGHASSRS